MFTPPDFSWDEPMSQFTAVERIAKKRGFTRQHADELALRSQNNAAAARDEGRFEREILVLDAPVLAEDGTPTGETKKYLDWIKGAEGQKVLHEKGYVPLRKP